jgi:hypothetical protein
VQTVGQFQQVRKNIPFSAQNKPNTDHLRVLQEFEDIFRIKRTRLNKIAAEIGFQEPRADLVLHTEAGKSSFTGNQKCIVISSPNQKIQSAKVTVLASENQ